MKIPRTQNSHAIKGASEVAGLRRDSLKCFAFFQSSMGDEKLFQLFSCRLQGIWHKFFSKQVNKWANKMIKMLKFPRDCDQSSRKLKLSFYCDLRSWTLDSQLVHLTSSTFGLCGNSSFFFLIQLSPLKIQTHSDAFSVWLVCPCPLGWAACTHVIVPIGPLREQLFVELPLSLSLLVIDGLLLLSHHLPLWQSEQSRL